MSQPTFRIDPKAKGKERRMLSTFGGILKEAGWKEVKGRSRKSVP